MVRKALDNIIHLSSDYNSTSVASEKETISASIIHQSLIYFLIIMGLTALRGFFLFLMRQTIIVMSRLIEFDLKNEIFNHYQKLTVAFYRRNNTGDLMNRISEDVGRVRMYIGPAVMYTFNLVVMFAFIIWQMVKVNPELAFYVLLPLPLLSVSIYFVSSIMNKRSEEVQEQQSLLSTYVQEAFSGIRVIKSFVKEKELVSGLANVSNEYKSRSMQLVKVNAWFFPLMLLLIGLSTIATVYVGSKKVAAGEITIGNIAEFIIYVNMLTWPVASLGWVTSLIQRAAASQQRINEFLNEAPDITSTQKKNDVLKGDIEFKNVSFTYPDSGIEALKNISFKLSWGKSLAIMGKTGSGKSTIAHLLLRLYDVKTGAIHIDEKNIQSLALEDYREQCGFVPQDVFLFSDTIFNNIAFGMHDHEDKNELTEKVIQAAKDAVIDDNIRSFPDAYETVIGERGITLSGGQKQRVSIARAIIRKPGILIFDDCLSAVDTHTEELILTHLKQIMHNRTSIIIGHRISTVKHADHILFLEDGRIAEEGDHESLMQKKGLYFALNEMQS